MFAIESLHQPPSSGRILLVDNPLNRRLVQQFIRRCFDEDYGAAIQHYARHLIALIDAENQVRAAMGYQDAGEESLFLEQYLDHPIEQVLTEKTGAPVQREQILEVGNLASRSSGWTRQLILSLAGYFHRQGYRWLVLTATPRVLNSFHKLGVGLELIPLAPADPQRLAGDPADWGSYYDESPLVLAGRIDRGLKRLRRNREQLQALLQTASPQRDHQTLIER